MAVGSLLVLLDDIAVVLDYVALMTKVAAKKTAGLLGDDLALNAEQVTGVSAERELPVVWAVTKGSFINKMILVPMALLISYFIPWLITPLLMVGGAFLCYEGFEKVLHYILHANEDEQAHKVALRKTVINSPSELVAFEKDKIKGAIRTDFILSAEIIVVALGTVTGASFTQQIIVVSGIAFLMTVGVYGLVAGIVKLDDAGIYLIKKQGISAWRKLQRMFGQFLLSFAPLLMRVLTVLGTAAMFLVGGSIINHGLPWLHHLNEKMLKYVEGESIFSSIMTTVAPFISDAILGIIIGAICFSLVSIILKVVPTRT
jgi:predicted DNA repair protein MutK